MIHLRVLGTIGLEREDGSTVHSVLSQPRRLALLSYLTIAAPRGFHRRDTLLGLFWPEYDEQRARAALSQALHFLRRSLGEGVILVRGREEVAVDPHALRCDAADVTERLADGSPESLTEALDGFAGDLLPGLIIDDAPEFDRWLASERVRLRSRVATAAWGLCEGAAAAGRIREAIEYGKRSLELGDADEARLRSLVALLDGVGDRAGAVRLYEEFAGRLQVDYDLEPSPETRAMVEDLRLRAEVEPATMAARAGATSIPPERPATPVASAERDRAPDPIRRRPFLRPTLAAATVAGAVVLIVALSGLVGRSPEAGGGSDTAQAPAEFHRAAVLPLRNLSPDAGDAYIAEGLSAELVSRLSRLRGLQVVPFTSTVSLPERGRSTRQIGRELGASLAVDGSVRKIGPMVRMDVSLVETATERLLWSGSYDAEVGQLLEVQRRVAEDVALRLRLTTRSSGSAEPRPGLDPRVNEEYLRGRGLLAGGDWSSVTEARERFRGAVDVEPAFAEAWSGFAAATVLLAQNGILGGPAPWEEARWAAQQALGFDADLSEAHSALASVHAFADWDLPSAEQHFRHALDLDPSDPQARTAFANMLRNQGRFDEALEHVRRLQELDPRQPLHIFQQANLLYLSGRLDQAVAILEGLTSPSASEERPAIPGDRFALAPFWPHFTLALARADLGDFDEAVASLRAADPAGARADTRALEAYIRVRQGRADEGRSMLEGMASANTVGPVSSFHRALVHVALGEHDRALDLLEEAARERTRLVQLLRVEPKFEPIRGTERFRRLLVMLNLATAEEVSLAGGR